MRTVRALPPDLDTRLSTLGEVLAQAHPDVVFAYLFGSAAVGATHGRSDVDLAIHLASAGDLEGARRSVALAAMRYLATDAVHVVVLNTAPVSLAGRVLLTRRVLVDRDPPARHAYEAATIRLFHDFRLREHRLLAARYARG